MWISLTNIYFPAAPLARAVGLRSIPIFWVILMAPYPAQSDINTILCYGQTLSVRMNVGDLTSDPSGYAVFNLPQPEQWSIPGYSVSGNIADAPCLAEPIAAGIVRSIPYRTTLYETPSTTDDILSDIISFALLGNRDRSFPDGSVDRLIHSSQTSIVDLGYGFSGSRITPKEQVISSPPSIKDGSWHIFFPNEYRSQTGDRIVANCTSLGTCTIEYDFSSKLSIRYVFRRDTNPVMDWIARDRAVRNFVLISTQN